MTGEFSHIQHNFIIEVVIQSTLMCGYSHEPVKLFLHGQIVTKFENKIKEKIEKHMRVVYNRK